MWDDLHPSLRALYIDSSARIIEHRWPHPYPTEEEIDNGQHLRRASAKAAERAGDEASRGSRARERGCRRRRSGAGRHRASSRAAAPDAGRGRGHGAQAQVLLELRRRGRQGKQQRFA